MNLRGSGGKATTLAMAAGVAAAEGASILYFMFTPWFLSPGDRSLYASLLCNLVLCLLMVKIVETCYSLRQWKDAVRLSVGCTLIYATVQAPYVITWWNPMTYTYLLGPLVHTLLQIAAINLSIWYFKNKK